MIRTTRHNISGITNSRKLDFLDVIFVNYKLCLEYYIDLILSGDLPLKMMLSSKDLPNYFIEHSRYKQLIYKQASEIVRSQIKKAASGRYKEYKKIYRYFKENGRQASFTNKKYSELNIKNILKSKYFCKPILNNLTITLDERFFDIKSGCYFDNFIKVISPFFNEKRTRALQINVPVKNHRHSNKFNTWNLRKSIQIKKINGCFYINFIFEKPEQQKKINGKSIGIDMGYKKLIATSDNQIIGTEMLQLYDKISVKKQGSKNFKQSLTQRDNLINFYVNQINIEDVNKIYIEDLLNVKYRSGYSQAVNNKMQRWSYPKTIDKLERMCEVNGINLMKVSPEYTSQTCSLCGAAHKESRNGENFKCVDCGYEIDADYNAAINIHNRGEYSLSTSKKDKCYDFI